MPLWQDLFFPAGILKNEGSGAFESESSFSFIRRVCVSSLELLFSATQIPLRQWKEH
jgi:hypothetical protein